MLALLFGLFVRWPLYLVTHLREVAGLCREAWLSRHDPPVEYHGDDGVH